MKKYYVIFDEEDGIEVDSYDVAEIVREQLNGSKTKGEQQDVLDEIDELKVGETYEYYNEYRKRNDLSIKRMG